MRDIEAITEALFARVMADGHAAVSVEDRHEADAVRAEFRRLARRFDARVRTIYADDDGTVIAARTERQPWDPTDEQVAEAMDSLLALDEDDEGD